MNIGTALTLFFSLFISFAHASSSLQMSSMSTMPSIPSLSSLISGEELAEREQFFDYDQNVEVLNETLVHSNGEYNIRRVKMLTHLSLTDEKIETQFNYYQVRKPQGAPPSPVVLIIPSIAGITPGEKGLAHLLAQKNISSVIITPREGFNDTRLPLEQINFELAAGTIQLRNIIDWLEQRPEVNAEKIGTFGLSLGGIRAALLLGVEPRVKVGALVVAGGDIAEILSHSEEPKTSRFRAHHLKRLGMTCEQFKDHLSEIIKLDPLIFAHKRNAQDIFMINANSDVYVPTKNQRKLWEAFGRPEKRVVNGGHPGGAISTLFYLKKILYFYQKKWRAEAQDTASTLPLVESL